jgi:DNA replicative helicase MCM subunit Mcm2 (Cdc46/Mcm family)
VKGRKILTTPYNMAFACLECQKSFKREFDLSKEFPLTLKCPNCGGISHNLGRHFKAPKKTDAKQWAKVKFLIEHGFFFQKIYDKNNNGLNIPYPKTLEEAEEFVVRYKEYAIQRNI